MRKRSNPLYPTMIPGDMVSLYAMSCEGFYKVGIAADPKKRMANFQIGCPFPIKLVAMRSVRHEVAVVGEHAAHTALKSFHHRGEWFLCEKADIVRALNKGWTKAAAALPKNLITDEEYEAVGRRIADLRRQFDDMAAAALQSTNSVQQHLPMNENATVSTP